MRSRDVHLTDSFLDDLNFLPAEYDKGQYFKFLEDYGTHYAASGTVGGKYELVYVLDNYAMSRIGMHSAGLAMVCRLSANLQPHKEDRFGYMGNYLRTALSSARAACGTLVTLQIYISSIESARFF